MSGKRRILLDLAVTLDGFIEGIHGEIDWCIMEPDMDFNSFLDQVDTIFFGRKSYELWKELLSDDDITMEDREMLTHISSMEKYVFSRTLASTPDFTVLSEHLTDEVEKIKAQQGKDIWLYGGSDLITTFMENNLIDEYRLSVHPVLLGEGKPLFTVTSRRNLLLKKVNTYPSGVVQLIYHPADQR